jgi:transcriptional regulator with XRE-family HTH domain
LAIADDNPHRESRPPGNRSGGSPLGENPLGRFLKDRRARLDPKSFGFSATRRRTPGLRREEVAQRANVSATWYTWLEQGRGGAPSADVLDRLARALDLNPVEREHLYLLAQQRPPQVRYRAAPTVTPRLQRLLDMLEVSPAQLRTPTWDVIAWNRAAAAVLTDFGALPPEERNIPRLIFSKSRARMPNWESDARLVVAALRADAARAGASEAITALVADLSARSPDFARMWQENDVGSHGEGTKILDHPSAGRLALEYSSFAVDSQPELTLVVYNPATPEDAARIRRLVAAQASPASAGT